MTTEPDEHREAFDVASRGVIAGALELAEGVAPHLSTLDVARAYLAAGSWLALPVIGGAATAAMLRELADKLEAGAPVRN